MGTGDWTLRCSPASSKNSWNKKSIYKLLKYRTKNSHNKYKLQAIIEVIKWHFYVSSPRLPPKILKGLRGFLMTEVKSAAEKSPPAKTPWGCYQPAPGYDSTAAVLSPPTGQGLKQGCSSCELGSELTEV